jgi:hypothetical protein
MTPREEIRIENARLYPAAVVERLLAVLSNGAELLADKTRNNLYDLEIGDRAYFIYVAPASGNVTLIATWVKRRANANEGLTKLVSWRRRIASYSPAV